LVAVTVLLAAARLLAMTSSASFFINSLFEGLRIAFECQADGFSSLFLSLVSVEAADAVAVEAVLLRAEAVTVELKAP
jgi:hypothetical protein